MKAIFLQVVGYGFLALGVLGLFLPFLQGILFLLIGLIILAEHAPWAQRLLERLRERYPKAGALIDGAEAKAAGWWHRVISLVRR